MTENDNIISFTAETLTYKCKKCSFIFTQYKLSPYLYVEPRIEPIGATSYKIPISPEDQEKKKHWWQ
jgi:hypothetical protein